MNRNEIQEYLYLHNNTKLDALSSSRNDFEKVYEKKENIP